MDSSAASKRGDSLNAEGDKALNRTLIFGFGKAGKYEDAAEAFKNAGNAYKLASLWQSAGDAFLKSADAHLVLESSTDACSNVVEAAQCYKKINPLDSVNAYRRAIDMYNEGGRFGMSARYCKEMAEVYEADSNAQGALEAYQ
ncbi:soluble NSF attachment protein, partial [Ochromonadaceae sp. CCMP2298]